MERGQVLHDGVITTPVLYEGSKLAYIVVNAHLHNHISPEFLILQKRIDRKQNLAFKSFPSGNSSNIKDGSTRKSVDIDARALLALYCIFLLKCYIRWRGRL